MQIPVMEVHQGEDGVWDALEVHVFSSSDVETVPSLDGFARKEADVRVAGTLRRLTVYLTGADAGWVTWDDAYA